MKSFIGSIALLVALWLAANGLTQAFAHDPEAEPTHLQWRTEGTLPETWAVPYRPAVVPEADDESEAIPITRFTDGSVRIAFVAGPPACVWEGADGHHPFSGRTLAVVGDEAWVKAGFGGVVYALSGRTCQGWGIDLCNTVWC